MMLPSSQVALCQWMQFCHSLKSERQFDLASSTGPQWTVAQLEALSGQTLNLTEMPLVYAEPEGSRALRIQVAAHLETDPEFVVITNGASEALMLAMLAVRGKRDTIVIPDPAYPGFLDTALALGMQTARYTLWTGDCFELTAEKIICEVSDRTSACVLNSPHNPTGAVMLSDDVENLARQLQERGTVLIVDEVFHPIYSGLGTQPSAAGLDNVIVVGDLSKAFSLPGLRIGWLVDADAARRNRIINLRSQLSVSSSPVLEAIAARALEFRGSIIQAVKERVTKNSLIADRLFGGSAIIDWLRPTGGSVAFPRLRGNRLNLGDWQRLIASGTHVVPGFCFGSDQHFRIGLAAEDENFEQAAENLLAFCDAHNRH